MLEISIEPIRSRRAVHMGIPNKVGNLPVHSKQSSVKVMHCVVHILVACDINNSPTWACLKGFVPNLHKIRIQDIGLMGVFVLHHWPEAMEMAS